MRSVVVVLPASMWAMMPMLRVRASGYSRISSPFAPFVLTSCSVVATCIVSAGTAINGPPSSENRPRKAGSVNLRRSPPVMRERLVRLGHLVHVLASLDRGARAVGGVHDLRGQALGQGVLTAGAAVGHQPPQRERGAARRLDLDRYLVTGTADATGLDLEHGPHVLDGLLEGDHRVVGGLLADLLERLVDGALGHGLLAVQQDLVDELGDQRVLVDGVGGYLATCGWALARHA